MTRALFSFATRPTTLVACVACLAAVAALVAASTPVGDPDVWWVAAAGRVFFESGSVIDRNTFSFTEPFHPFIMHEWLLGPLYAAGLVAWGPKFFNAVAAATLALAATLVVTWTSRQARHPTTALIMLLLVLGCFGSRFLTARPSGVALLYPIALVALVFGRTYSLWRAALAVLLQLVWSNTHGSFPLGPVLLVVAALARSDRHWARLGTAAAMAAVSLVNPYGLALHRFVLEYFLGREDIYREIHANIVEFRPFWGAWGVTAGPVELVGLVAVGVLSVRAALQPEERVRGFFGLALIALAALNARHIELAGLLCCLLLLGPLDASVLRWSLPQPPAGWRRLVVLGVLVPVWVGGAAVFAWTAGQRRAEDWLGESAAFVHALARVPDGANAYVPFAESGVAIWYGFPRGVRVFYDARNDCYSAATHRAFFALQKRRTPSEQIRRILTDSNTTAVVVPPEHRLSPYLSSATEWRLVARGPSFRAYVERATPERRP